MSEPPASCYLVSQPRGNSSHAEMSRHDAGTKPTGAPARSRARGAPAASPRARPVRLPWWSHHRSSRPLRRHHCTRAARQVHLPHQGRQPARTWSGRDGGDQLRWGTTLLYDGMPATATSIRLQNRHAFRRRCQDDSGGSELDFPSVLVSKAVGDELEELTKGLQRNHTLRQVRHRLVSCDEAGFDTGCG